MESGHLPAWRPVVVVVAGADLSASSGWEHGLLFKLEEGGGG
jgi:hypothetical protein